MPVAVPTLYIEEGEGDGDCVEVPTVGEDVPVTVATEIAEFDSVGEDENEAVELPVTVPVAVGLVLGVDGGVAVAVVEPMLFCVPVPDAVPLVDGDAEAVGLDEGVGDADGPQSRRRTRLPPLSTKMSEMAPLTAPSTAIPFGDASVATAAKPSALPVTPAAPTRVRVVQARRFTARIAFPSVTKATPFATARPYGAPKSATPCAPSTSPATPETPATVDTYVPLLKFTYRSVCPAASATRRSLPTHARSRSPAEPNCAAWPTASRVPGTPEPAKRESAPVASTTLRIRLFKLSEMYTATPAASTMTASGPLSRVPLDPAAPVPATVIVAFALMFTTRARLLSVSATHSERDASEKCARPRPLNAAPALDEPSHAPALSVDVQSEPFPATVLTKAVATKTERTAATSVTYATPRAAS